MGHPLDYFPRHQTSDLQQWGGLQTFRILNFVVGSFVPRSIVLIEGSILRHLGLSGQIAVEDPPIIVLF